MEVKSDEGTVVVADRNRYIEDAEYEEVKNETQAESETEATETQETGKKPRKNSKRTKDNETD